ncbi:fumarylacetoacetate hydrolase family protein [Bacillus swezeyi]|uniref:Fumarylacetoacetate hydrolase n=2 Tax=Bacillus swezeyi TaxID=1925020 RepID=A0A1R1RVS6_9BACI|nr:fumarylacetoacetate hydrolase family protein [Bacillus swezeyi]MEC1261842.1 fumarylacetoacetate hydrolase family protein [Bacillus swezeyi]MED2926295.1 fumarylacetoacetate hydrolase family protein [Bacillus swezeyi]MED2943765.1 fumarylacetoacetate hydrolase family protein [Bacillus swezeyi]MED2966142.1 fumarylacetoacetate hydrolase family protein [Bacillus swezeyi]MED2978771.1 fumarylacetoacetate hydrolase family protein [Bacillus swezeyi]
MKLATVSVKEKEFVVIINGEQMVSIETINQTEGKEWRTDLFGLIQENHLSELNRWYRSEGEHKLSSFPIVGPDDIQYVAPYKSPGKILGVGMNYVEKAIELSGQLPQEEPVIFMKPNSSLIGPDEFIKLPPQSSEVTAEAELSIIIGKTCKDVAEEDAIDVVAGFTTSLDVTAKDIHAKNPRYMQRAKSFDTFFSFGPYFITPDEFPVLKDISVETVLNGEGCHQNIVENMMYQPWWIVSFFSQIMTLNAGDIIMTGTPGSAVIRDGDIVECRIPGFKPLYNPVSKFKAK